MIVLDTDVLIEIFDRDSSEGKAAVKKIDENGEQVCTTAINLHEFMYGIVKHNKMPKEIMAIPVLSYTKEDAILSSKIEVDAERKGKKVSKVDAIIASIAINNGCRVFTRNIKHFENFEHLELF